jgi:N-acylneuraminate cytidylyltransferase
VDRVVVSTDDEQIGRVSESYGAEVIWRPAAIGGDSARSEAALLHALSYLEQEEGYRPALLTCLQCTAPLTLPADIDGTVEALRGTKAHCAFAATLFHHFVWRPDEFGNMTGLNHNPRFRRRQDQSPQYLESGAVYVMRAQRFRETGHRFFGRTAVYLMPRERAVEIDEPGDLVLAEALLRVQEEKSLEFSRAAVEEPAFQIQ